ncbi:hypothetical protein OGAPHI_006475 [Ogataea philodendri]|uniref:Secreted protein n=1 Tax=Ogataea philodendri TaxID=1378263 RepID=A0A9P8T1F4_9ASCO|nr:uncharacterized protein OGAPHI_006475 [Ogataea philodendri]KAH3661626.1 hypothetical protein OGAPHI_006475 [Ogataea philodendri]
MGRKHVPFLAHLVFFDVVQLGWQSIDHAIQRRLDPLDQPEWRVGEMFQVPVSKRITRENRNQMAHETRTRHQNTHNKQEHERHHGCWNVHPVQFHGFLGLRPQIVVVAEHRETPSGCSQNAGLWVEQQAAQTVWNTNKCGQEVQHNSGVDGPVLHLELTQWAIQRRNVEQQMEEVLVDQCVGGQSAEFKVGKGLG